MFPTQDRSLRIPEQLVPGSSPGSGSPVRAAVLPVPVSDLLPADSASAAPLLAPGESVPVPPSLLSVLSAAARFHGHNPGETDDRGNGPLLYTDPAVPSILSKKSRIH